MQLFLTTSIFAQSNTVYLPNDPHADSNKAIDVTKPVGVVKGQHGVSATGGATYTIPIALPPATNGFAPNVALSYNSQGGNGIAGYGWNIAGLSAITRGSKNFYNDGVVQASHNTADDVYMLDGQRLVLLTGTQGALNSTYGTENENFARATITQVCANGPWVWQVTTKDGTIMDYGSMDMSNGSSVNNVGNWVYWRLYKVTDRNGNYYTYTYDNADNDSRIKEINYTGNATASLLPYNKIAFNYSIRQDQNTVYDNGLAYNQKYILDNIVVTGEGALAFKTYTFNKSKDSLYSYLTEVIEKGTDTTKLNSTVFKYGNKPVEASGKNCYYLNPSLFTTFDVVDLNADGYSDLIRIEKTYVDQLDYNLKDNKLFTSPIWIGNGSPFTLPVVNIQSNPSNASIAANITNCINNISNFFDNVVTGPIVSDLSHLIINGVQYALPSNLNSTQYQKNYGDYNGDGKSDLLLSKFSEINQGQVGINIRLAAVPSSADMNITSPTSTLQNVLNHHQFTSSEKKYLLNGDFDGDGKSDIITCLFSDPGISTLSHRIFSSFYTRPSITGCENMRIYDPYNEYDLGYFTDGESNEIDFDGDGKTDIMVTNGSRCTVYNIIPCDTMDNAGYHFKYKYNKLYFSNNAEFKDKKYYGDFNGDGKTDVLILPMIMNSVGTAYGSYSSPKIAYSTGKGFVFTPFTIQSGNWTPNLGQRDFIIADYNGDGKADILHAFEWDALQTGTNVTSIDIYYSTGVTFAYKKVAITQDFYRNAVTADFNGDGKADLFDKTTLKYIQFNTGGVDLFLDKVTNGNNATTQFTYKKLTDTASFYTRNNTVPSIYPLNNLQIPKYCVDSIKTPNGLGGINVKKYAYEDLIAHRAGRGLLGFLKIKTDDLINNNRTIEEFAIDTTYYINLPTKTSQYLLTSTGAIPAGTLISSQTTANAIIPQSSGRFLLQQPTTTATDWLENATTTLTQTYDAYNNVLSQTNTLNAGTPWLETETSTTAYTNAGGLAPYLPSTATSTKSRAGQPAVSTTTNYAYNALGQLSSKTNFAGLPNAITTTYTYNAFGNVLSETLSSTCIPSIASRSYTMTYDTKGRFVLSKAKNCGSCGANFNQTETFSYNILFGLPTRHTSSDCQNTTYTYDAFGRLTTTTLPTGIVVGNSSAWDLTNGMLSYSKTSYPGKPDQTTWFDVLGRVRKTTTELINQQLATQYTTYNANGQVATKTNSYKDGVETPITTSYTYDDFNRPKIETTPNINTYTYTYTYPNNKYSTTKTDISGKFATSLTDASGKIVQSQDAGGTVGFTYDSWGNQRYTFQNGKQVSTKTYDAYNRLSTMQEVNAGTISYVYNAFGEITKQTDASGNTYTMVYDNLGRLQSKIGAKDTTNYGYYCRTDSSILSGSTTSTLYWKYNYCCNNNITQIYTVPTNPTATPAIPQLFTYDAFARLTQKDETVEGTVYSTKYTYDANDNTLSTTYPSGIQINNVYDANGYLLSVNQQGVAGNIYTTNTANGMGQITQYTLGNGKTSTQTYTNGFPTNYTTPTIQNYSMQWDYSAGNLLQRKDIKGTTTLSENFTYDKLNRLTSAQVVGQVAQSFAYDAPSSSSSQGNITTNNQNYTRYTASQIHTPSSVMNATSPQTPPVSMDTNAQTITYTPFQRINSISQSVYNQQFTYWPDYDRVKSVLSQNTTLLETRYYFGNMEKQIIGAITSTPTYIHYISGGNSICAIITLTGATATTHYVYTDHLGSISTLTNNTGAIEATQAYDAWGRKRNPQDWSYTTIPTVPTWLYRGYTGHEGMPQFGLINMNARLYDPALGKMISPDNFVKNPNSTQDYNRYAYAGSNPMNHIDPDGNNPILIALLVYGLFFTETGFKVQKVFSPVALHVQINLGSENRGVGIEGSIGIPQAFPISYRLNAGIGYNWKNYYTGKGWETKTGSEWGIGIAGFGMTYSTTKYNSPGTEFDQTTGTIGLFAMGGVVNLSYENDYQPDFFNNLPLMYHADHGDRNRTAAMRLNIGFFSAGFNLFTGDPEEANGKRPVDPFHGNASGTYNGGTADKYRAGVLYIGFGPIRLGANTEGIRHAIQNRFAHDILQHQHTPWFKRLDNQFPNQFYWNIGSGFGGLW